MDRQLVSATLLKTSSKNDVLTHQGKLDISGLADMRLRDLISLQHVRPKAEQVKKHRIGDTTDPTIQASTLYSIQFFVEGEKESYDRRPHIIRHKTPATLSGSPATDRQNVYDSLADKINSDDSLPVTADARSGGTYMEITDDGNYLSYHQNKLRERKPVGIKLLPDDDTTGFDNDTHLEVSQEAIVPFGQGADLKKLVPQMDPKVGNFYSGHQRFEDLENAVEGQNYAGFFFEALVPANSEVSVGRHGYKFLRNNIYVDDGTGDSTTNLSGYLDFKRELLSVMVPLLYSDQKESIVEFFESTPVLNANGGGAATSGDGDEGVLQGEDGALHFRIDGATDGLFQGLVNSGYDLDRASGNLTDNEGFELSGPVQTISGKEAVARQQSFTARAVIEVKDASGISFNFGVREKEAYKSLVAGGALPSYKAFAALGTQDDVNIDTIGKTNSVAKGTNDTTVDLQDGTEVELIVHVDGEGYAYTFIDGTEYTPKDTNGDRARFADGKIFIPFLSAQANGLASDPGFILKEFVFTSGYDLLDADIAA